MLSTAEALRAVLANTPVFGGESVPVSEATGRVLKQAVIAERDQPPFDRVMMDGIAFSSADVQRAFPIQGMQAAGDTVMTLEAGKCIEIMTGAARPTVRIASYPWSEFQSKTVSPAWKTTMR